MVWKVVYILEYNLHWFNYLPNNLLIIDELGEKKLDSRYHLQSYQNKSKFIYLLKMLTYCNQSYDRQGVVEGVPENSPPGQQHHLRIYRSKGRKALLIVKN